MYLDWSRNAADGTVSFFNDKADSILHINGIVSKN